MRLKALALIGGALLSTVAQAAAQEYHVDREADNRVTFVSRAAIEEFELAARALLAGLEIDNAGLDAGECLFDWNLGVEQPRNLENVPLAVELAVDRLEAGDAVELRFADGSTARGVLVIGADGVKSVVRDLTLGPVPATYTGDAAWRVIVPAERLPAGFMGHVMAVWMGPGRHAVCYYIRGGALLNFVGLVETTELVWIAPAIGPLLRRSGGRGSPDRSIAFAPGPSGHRDGPEPVGPDPVHRRDAPDQCDPSMRGPQ